MKRGLATLLLVLAAHPAWAQLSEGYLTDFENTSPPWSFQFLSESVRWKIDSSPVSFTTPLNTLNNIDSSSGVQEVGDAEAFSPTSYFGGTGKRYISFWCKYFPISSENGTRRSLKIGSNLFSETPTVTIFFDDNALTNNEGLILIQINGLPDTVPPTPGDPPDGPTFPVTTTCPGTDAPGFVNPGEFLVTCGDPNGWHQHIFEVADPAGEIVYTGPGVTGAPIGATAFPVPTGSLTEAAILHDKIVLQVSFHYQQSFEAGNCPPAGSGPPRWGCQGWMIDDFKLLRTQTDPFAPDPAKAGAASGKGGKGGGFKCLHEPLADSSRGPMPLALFTSLLAAGACALKRRLA